MGNLLGGSDDLSWARGHHQIAFGIGGGHFTNEEYNKGRDTGRVTINGSITGLGMADFMTGNVSTFDQAGQVLRDDYKWYLGAYGSDAWKATPKLTVNFGTRWEPYFPQTFKRGGSMNFNLDAFMKGDHTSVYKNAPPGLFFDRGRGRPGPWRHVHQMDEFFTTPRPGIRRTR